jgi:tetratricopeptide (TPR) repeat protein
MSFAPGENVGAYRVVEQLGSGGMATVYKAYHASLDRYVALKVMHPAFKGDANFLARFQREARVVAKLEHPNIIPVYDFSEHKGSPYLVMRFVEGETLKARLERDQLTLPEILDVIRPMGEALTYAHEQGVLHRDIKPSNVILSDTDRVFLTDFGLARIVQAGESSLTRDAMVGTPYYISPEQAIGKSELNARTDIYSFGVVLYELFTGRVPFQSDTPFAVIHDHIYTPLPLPTSVNPDLPPELEKVLLKALAKEPEDRYASAVELVTAVEQVITGVAAIPPAQLDSTPTPVSRETVPSQPQALKSPAQPQPEPIPVPTARTERQGKPAGAKLGRWLMVAGGLAILAAVVAAAILLLGGARDNEPQVVELTAAEQPLEERPPSDDLPPLEDSALYVELGRELLADGETETALAVFEEAIMQDPEATEVYEEIARLLFEYGEWDPAIEVLSSLQDSALYVELGRELLADGEFEAALEVFEEAIMQNPEATEVYQEVARLLVEYDEWELAIEVLYEGVEANPNDPALRLTLAQALVVADDWEDALPELEWLIERKPGMAEPHAYLGVYLAVEVEDLEGARAEIDRALNIDPESPEAHFAQGVYYWKLKNFRLARQELERAQLSPRAPPLLARRIQFYLERLDQADAETP